MSHKTNQPGGTIVWQLCIRIEGYDVSDSLQHANGSTNDTEPVEVISEQESVEITELASFPLVAHPFSFRHVPLPWAMEQEKSIGSGAWILLVKPDDRSSGSFY